MTHGSGTVTTRGARGQCLCPHWIKRSSDTVRPQHARLDVARGRQALVVLLQTWGLLLALVACGQAPRPESSSPAPEARDSGCRTCHPGAARGLSGPHSPDVLGCVICHQGAGQAQDKTAAHTGLDAFPGGLARADQSCGRSSCHADALRRVKRSPMATQGGLRALTRAWLSPQGGSDPAVHARLASRLLTLTGPLETGGIDDYLRRLCASCHLGQPRTHHGLSTTDRGGGCSACHLERRGAEPSEKALSGAEPDALHPGLTSAPDDARCFGCHSRSARISLSYVGLVELPSSSDTQRVGEQPVEEQTVQTQTVKALSAEDTGSQPRTTRRGRTLAARASSPLEARVGYLADGRPVAQREPDVHRQAGMGCIDCHTGGELMGWEPPTGAPEQPAGALLQREVLQIQCQDCHAPALTTRTRSSLTPAERLREVRNRPGTPTGLAVAATARGGTPLFQLEDPVLLRDPVLQGNADRRVDSAHENRQDRQLWTRREARRLSVPVASSASHRLEAAHVRLTCESCHAGWAPWCEGCHIEQDPEGQQWDHQAQAERPGAWIEKSWGAGARPPALGVDHRGQIAPFVPGMHLTLGAGTGAPGLTRKLYSRVSPHTTGKRARSCESCHAQSLSTQDTSWTGLHPGDRRMTRLEQSAMTQVGRCLPCHSGDSALYSSFQEGLKRLATGPAIGHPDPHAGLVKKEKTR